MTQILDSGPSRFTGLTRSLPTRANRPRGRDAKPWVSRREIARLPKEGLLVPSRRDTTAESIFGQAASIVFTPPVVGSGVQRAAFAPRVRRCSRHAGADVTIYLEGPGLGQAAGPSFFAPWRRNLLGGNSEGAFWRKTGWLRDYCLRVSATTGCRLRRGLRTGAAASVGTMDRAVVGQSR